VLGLFCAGWDSPGEALRSLVDDLDDFILFPFNRIDLMVRIQRLLTTMNDFDATSRALAIKEKFNLHSLVGESECFLQVIEKIPPIAASDVTVVILGETGTGKELFARAIHYTSSRRDKPFVPVNCGALPDQLFENEMFGHIKGAFTDASSVEKGILSIAEGGTLFLDEIDGLSPAAQIKLLRFLQDREYRPLGSSKSLVANVRILAATNADLRKQVELKMFREDLYHRLNIISLTIPPLRDRIGDIPLLASRLLSKYSSQHGRDSFRLGAGPLQKLMAYSWPGNVRELEGVVQRAVILSPSSTLRAADIDVPIPYEEDVEHDVSLQEAKTQVVGQFERTYLASLLTVHHGNISRAAKAAGTERRTFQRLLQKYGLKGQTFRA
jgi:DNA-binding NtrC family response regulator